MRERTLLVVDDEYWIRRHLMQAFDWAQFGIQCILEAANGEEAKAVLEAQRVDVLLTDMDMPYVDGLTLIRFAQAAHPHVMILVLSGYSDFDMVRGAMVGGAVDYLLKPVDKTTLYAAMGKLIEKDEQLRKSTREVRDLKFIRLLRGEYTELGMDELTNGMPWRLVVCQFRRERTALAEDRESTRTLVETHLGTKNVFLNPWTRGEMLAVLPEDRYCAEQAWTLTKAMKQLPETAWARVLISKPILENELRHTYKRLNEHYGMRPFTPEDMQVFIDGVDTLLSYRLRLPEEAESSLRRAVKSGNSEVVDMLLRSLFVPKRLIEEGWLLGEVASAMAQCAQVIIRTAEKRGCSPDTGYALHTLRDDIDSLFRLHGTEDALPLLLQMAELIGSSSECCEVLSRIDEIIAWLDIHYTDNVTLTSLSEQFHLSPSYLSRSFKKATGSNVIAYITEKRMALAQRLLAQGEPSLSDIAFLTGYDDYSYFSNVFRRCTGQSPSSWQKGTKI